MKLEIINDVWRLFKLFFVIVVTWYITYKTTKLSVVGSKEYRKIKYYKVIYHWLKNKQENISIYDWFNKNECKRIAIYGIADIGQWLLKDISDTDIEVKYIVDRASVRANNYNVPIIPFNEIPYMDDVDVIVITPVYIYNDLAENVRKTGSKIRTVSIEEVICGCIAEGK